MLNETVTSVVFTKHDEQSKKLHAVFERCKKRPKITQHPVVCHCRIVRNKNYLVQCSDNSTK